MGCGDVCPFVPAKERIEWDIPDPQGESIEKFREVRDQIKKILTEFLKKL